jgi:hypothetical protein
MPILAQENGFGSSMIAKFAMAGERHSSNSLYTPAEKECNKYDLTSRQCF